MDNFDQLDKWIDKNAPGLNKKVLHTQVASTVSSETPVSDFSTAEVTINVADSISGGARISVPTVIPNGDYAGVNCSDFIAVGSGVSASISTVPLYKGKAFLTVGGQYTITTSGNVIYDADNNELVVTGDGTVNVTDITLTPIDDTHVT